MHEVDQDVVVMFTLVKILFDVFESYNFIRVYEGFEVLFRVIEGY